MPNSLRSLHRQAAFTLLEVLLALVIFASLSLTAYQVLQGVMRNDALTKVKVERLAAMQRVFTMLDRDFSQMIPRPSRVNGEVSKVVFQAARFQMESDDWSVSFVRNGWFNPGAQLPRSNLQKVGYRLRENKLERLSYLYVDPVIGTEPLVTPLLDRVKGFKLRFYVNGLWATEWNNSAQLPRAIEVELELEDYGIIRRRFMILSEGS
jgi:general secretion pathway protein J